MDRKRLIFLTGILLVSTLTALAGDSATVTVRVVIPEVLRIETADEPLVFDLVHPNPGETYPPPVFPAYYSPGGSPAEGIPVRIFCNFKRAWHLSMAVTSPLSGPGGNLPADRLEWSADGRNWHGMAVTPQEIATGNQGAGWQNQPIRYRLRLEGDESGSKDAYATTITYSLTSP